MTTGFLVGQSQFATKIWGGPSYDPTPTGLHGILFTTTDITLDWTQIDEASSYQLQVSLFPDFRTTFVDIVAPFAFYDFSDLQINDAKRYWRFRPHNGTSYFLPWSEVGSYWVDTTAAQPIELTRGQWLMADPELTTDTYIFDTNPMFTTVPSNIYRIQDRNRLGTLLSELLTIKWNIQLMFTGAQYVDHMQVDEFRRYHNDVRTFFLCAFIDGKWHVPMPHIWKVEFTQDPTLTMIASGRQDLLSGTLTFTEV